MTPDEAAAWIANEIRVNDYLDHAEVIARLESAHPDLIAYNDRGNPVVAPSVLKAFKKLNPPDIVWSRSGLHWRLREAGDERGRLAP
ncbi:DUF6953 family protein [Sphingomonas sp.]|uniref:DUF6953 family protein n=1 Tax=Sphingomonas sp. TaxID=28214 RepID=UPI003FA72184